METLQNFFKKQIIIQVLKKLRFLLNFNNSKTIIYSKMSHFLKENLYQPKNLTQNRVLMLTEKINALKLGNKVNVDTKFDTLQRQISQVERQLEHIVINFNDKNFEMKHIFNKINKELSFDYVQMDRQLQEETQQCEQLALAMINRHIQERKESDSRLSRFIDQKCAIIRDLSQRQSQQRANNIKQIEDSLMRDLAEIKDKLQSENYQKKQKIEDIHEQFVGQYEKMRIQFKEMSEKYSESEEQFYKMLRDVIKKVKSELGQGKKERQCMQESILVLIEKLCDKAIEEGGIQ